MTAAAAPVMYGPDGMRLFLVAAPAAIIAALVAAASTNGNTSPVAKAPAPGQPGNMPGTPAGWPHVCPAQAPRVRAGERETVLGRCSHPAGNPPGATSSMRVDGVPQHRAWRAASMACAKWAWRSSSRSRLLRDARHEHLAPPIMSTVMAVCFRARATAP